MTDGILSSLMGSSPPTKFAETQSRGFCLLVSGVVKSKTKHEEGQVIQRELETLKVQLAQPKVSVVQLRDYLCRLVFCHMLGYDVSFGCIHAVKYAQQGTLMDKKIGYLVCCLLLDRNHELILLLINSLQKDLKSSNLLDNLFAMSAASQLVPAEMIPSILPLVIAKLKHQRGFVRAKAVMCLYQFQLLAPDLLDHCRPQIEGALLDKDPGVMAAAVHVLHHGIQKGAAPYVSVGDSLVEILRQLNGRQMPAMFEYQNIQFPWLQIQIIKCLTSLAQHDHELKKKTAAMLAVIMKKTSLKEHIAFGILYECIASLIAMRPDTSHLNLAAEHVKRFLNSADPNLKAIGVKLLVSLVQVDPGYSGDYQDFIVQTLDHPDIHIRRKMHCVLFGIASESNMEVVCGRLLEQLQKSCDNFWKTELVTMLLDLCNRFGEKYKWQIDTVFSTLQTGGDCITSSVVNSVIASLEKGYLRSESSSPGGQYLVQKCVAVLVASNTAHCLLHVAVWVVGELCPLLRNMADDKVLGLFTRLLTNAALPYSVHSGVVSCLQKLLIQQVVQPHSLVVVVQECCNHALPLLIKQRLLVLQAVSERKMTLTQHDPVTMDTTLSILDDLVCEHLEAGAALYIPPHLRHAGKSTSTYPETGSVEESLAQSDVSYETRDRTESTHSSSKAEHDNREGGAELPRAKRLWGRDGRIQEETRAATDSYTQPADRGTEEDRDRQKLGEALFGVKQPSSQVPSLLDCEDDTISLPKRSGPWSTPTLRTPHLSGTDTTPVSMSPTSTSDGGDILQNNINGASIHSNKQTYQQIEDISASELSDTNTCNRLDLRHSERDTLTADVTAEDFDSVLSSLLDTVEVGAGQTRVSVENGRAAPPVRQDDSSLLLYQSVEGISLTEECVGTDVDQLGAETSPGDDPEPAGDTSRDSKPGGTADVRGGAETSRGDDPEPAGDTSRDSNPGGTADGLGGSKEAEDSGMQETGSIYDTHTSLYSNDD